MSPKKPRPKTLGEVIKDAAAEKGWSIRELARRADLPPATVQKVVSEKGIVSRVETLQRIAHALNLPVTMLLEAAAADAGYTRTTVPSSQVDVIVASLHELPPEKLREVQALVEAMLTTERMS